MIMSGIYAIHSPINGKTYIGSTIHINTRWNAHKSNLRRNKHSNQHLQNAWNKYGETAFFYTLLEECEFDSLLKLEQEWLDRTPRKYNISEIVHPGRQVKKSPETCLKISKAKLGKKFSDQHILNLKTSHLRHRTHCPKGHEFTANNLDKCSQRKGIKRCRTCKNNWQHILNRKNKLATDKLKYKPSKEKPMKLRNAFTVDAMTRSGGGIHKTRRPQHEPTVDEALIEMAEEREANEKEWNDIEQDIWREEKDGY